MILIADSGSTKCDWLVLNQDWDIINHVKTMGYNPYFHNHNFISADLMLNDFFKEHQSEVKQVYFYGAGCSTEEYKHILFAALSTVFTEAEIAVDHDLMASALAFYRGEPIISCILGTGSNSCYFDGEKLSSGNPSLGYILGDEASGSYFGKQLLNAFFYNRLPHDLHSDLERAYHLTHADLTAKVYGTNKANVYLASFMKFFSARRDHPYIQQMVKEGFREFIEKHVCCFENHKQVKVNFVGSIAFFFQEEIEQISKEYHLSLGEFVQKPVFSLVDYHRLQETNKVKQR